MSGLIIVALVFPQQLEQGDGAGGEQAVGADDDQQYGQEIKGDRKIGIHRG